MSMTTRILYEDFTPEEIAAILTAAEDAEPVIKFPNLLAAHHGSRLAEIVEAQTQDVYQDPTTGIWVFDVRLKHRPRGKQRVKTAFSARRLPIPKMVVESFLEYVEEVRRDYYDGGHGPLFPMLKLDQDGRLNTDASRIIMGWLRTTVGIKDPTKRFHSWRHTVATILNTKKVRPRTASFITGHAPRTKGEKYIHPPLRELQEAIELIHSVV
jgi:integrase